MEGDVEVRASPTEEPAGLERGLVEEPAADEVLDRGGVDVVELDGGGVAGLEGDGAGGGDGGGGEGDDDSGELHGEDGNVNVKLRQSVSATDICIMDESEESGGRTRLTKEVVKQRRMGKKATSSKEK